MDPKKLLDGITQGFSKRLGHRFVDLYAHGSLAHGDFEWQHSGLQSAS